MGMRFAFFFTFLAFFGNPAYAQTSDQHSVDGLVSALTTPLSQQAISEAREFDDKLLGEGHTGEQRVYLITDERSRKVNDIGSKLLTALGHDPGAWVVRVLDTKPSVSNAFVIGGRYVYVFTGFLQEAGSDDEIAFVLAHELGHSLLKHGERQQSDFSMQLAGLLELIGELAKGKTAENLTGFAHAMQAQYSQQDEAEADALGAAITIRSGFDPLRGVDFFTRSVREQDEETQGAALSEDQLQAMRAEVDQLQTACLQWTNAWNGQQIAQTQDNANQVNSICADAENKRVAFNRANEDFHMARARKALDGL
ncbi:MAG: M48 family metallopeptidase, partial [Acidobacteriales bacterium]|nr:M48 family metallopeptidase [Terriglobales bacterium]